MTGLSIGKYINHRLSNTPEVTSFIKDKFFPLVTFEDLEFPFLSYSSSLEPLETKDGTSGDVVSVEIIIVDNKFSRSADIAEAVRKALDGKRSTEFCILSARMLSASNESIENTFVQRLIFEFITE